MKMKIGIRERMSRRPRAGAWVRAGAAALLGVSIAAACEYPFEPYQETRDAPFSMVGYLDLRADTQWVRVMPIRQSLLPGPEPIDAVVTLEETGGGRTVTLRDSVFRFIDPALGTEAYAHNFWTTEPLVPGAVYRLRAERSDGAVTTAEVVMPPELEFTFRSNGPDFALLRVPAKHHLLTIEVSFAMSTEQGERAPAHVIPQQPPLQSDDPTLLNLFLDSSEILIPGRLDMRRHEIRLAVAEAGWPYRPDLTDLEVRLPGVVPSNVEGGYGYVGGVAVWNLPFHRCVVIPPPTGIGRDCLIPFSRSTASISGTVRQEPCGEPLNFGMVRLREMFDDEEGVLRTWWTGWDGEYRFEAITPGAQLFLDLGPGTPEIRLPTLSAGQEYVMEELSVPGPC